MNERENILQHLENDFIEPIRDPVWKHIYFSKPYIRIIQCREFQNLHHIKQLGPAYLVYPGATHTRFSHSLGVFHIARLMMLKLVKKTPPPEFTLPDVKAFLCAALLHDLGHYPFAHSLKELNVCGHEQLTAQKILDSGLSEIIRKELGILPETVAAIIDKTKTDDSGYRSGSGLIHFYQRLLSGVLDPDKLDYLNRDAYFCGIPYGRQDVDYIISDINPHLENGLSISEQGLTSVESLLFSKYVMYRTVYWHKTVRIATAMVKKALLCALDKGIVRPEQLYNLSDHTLFALPQSSSFEPLKLLGMVSGRSLYKQVFSVRFNPEEKAHVFLENLGNRVPAETTIAKEISAFSGEKISGQDIVIDIPEKISFEIDVLVRSKNSDKDRYFHESGSVFTPETVNNFVHTLRHISIAVADRDPVLKAIKKIDMHKLIRIIAGE